MSSWLVHKMVRPIRIENEFIKIRWEGGETEKIADYCKITVHTNSSRFKTEV